MGGDLDHLVLGASVAGPLHVREDLPCQDRFAVARRDGALLVAVADGLGSAPRSDVGAEIAVRAAVGHAEPDAARMVHAAREALVAEAATAGCELRDLGCTLIAVVAEPGGVSVAHVGDGAVVALAPDGLRVVSGPGDSEYANEVDSLAAGDWESAVRLTRDDGAPDALAIFTDGCQRAALRFGEPHPGFFGPLFDYARTVTDRAAAQDELAALLGGEKLSEHSEDDKTLVLVVWS